MQALRYHRFSDKGQSHGSIERQNIITSHWCSNNSIEIVGTFNDDGYSAKSFDRPDIKKLFSFIKEQKSKIDYLIVAELTRFSRQLGDAINMVTQIQKDYGIQIVSSGRNSIYDVNDPTSFFMMSIEFTLGNTDNLQRENNINGGIYTAKKEGRYIGSTAPFGYEKTGIGKNRKLEIKEDTANVIRYIFAQFIAGMPIMQIGKTIRQNGFPKMGHSIVREILINPIYNAKQQVKPWKDKPGGLYPVNVTPIIDDFTWAKVQQLINSKKKHQRTSVLSDDLPLRGVVKCHCGCPLTGAPSTGGGGQQYWYYKCNIKSAHNNISAIKAHDQLQQVLELMSLPTYMVDAIRDQSKKMMAEAQLEKKASLNSLKAQMKQVEDDMQSLEEKYIRNIIQDETYRKWSHQLMNKRQYAKSQIYDINNSNDKMQSLLEANIHRLSDMRFVFNAAETLDKQNLIRIMFDNSLYYQEKSYRTNNIMSIFSHNLQIMSEKGLLFVHKKPDFLGEIRSGGAHPNTFEQITLLLKLIRA